MVHGAVLYVALEPAQELRAPSCTAQNTIRKSLLTKWAIDFGWYCCLDDVEWILVWVKKCSVWMLHCQCEPLRTSEPP